MLNIFYLRVILDDAMLTDVDSVFEAKLVGHLPFGTLTKAHLDLWTLGRV